MAKRTLNMNLVGVITILVDRVGMHDLVLALAAVAHAKGLASADSGLAREWQGVAITLKRFARVRLRGLR